MLPSFVSPRLSAECTAWHWVRPSSRSTVQVWAIAFPLIDQIVSLLAPPLCAVCGSACHTGAALCGRCDRDLATAPVVIEPGPPGVELAVAASPFEGSARAVVHGLKYARRLSLAGIAA